MPIRRIQVSVDVTLEESTLSWTTLLKELRAKGMLKHSMAYLAEARKAVKRSKALSMQHGPDQAQWQSQHDTSVLYLHAAMLVHEMLRDRRDPRHSYLTTYLVRCDRHSVFYRQIAVMLLNNILTNLKLLPFFCFQDIEDRVHGRKLNPNWNAFLSQSSH